MISVLSVFSRLLEKVFSGLLEKVFSRLLEKVVQDKVGDFPKAGPF